MLIYKRFAPPCQNPDLTIFSSLPAFYINRLLFIFKQRLDDVVRVLSAFKIIRSFFADNIISKKLPPGIV